MAEFDSISLMALLITMFLAGLAEVVFPPLPGDAVFLAGGFIAARRGFSFTYPLLASCLGTFFAVAGLFYLGRIWGSALLERRFFLRLLPQNQQERVARWFARYGAGVLLCSRFIPVVRSGLALAAGLAGMRPVTGLGSLALGVVLFNSVLVIGGSIVGDRWRELGARLATLGWAALALGGLVLAVRAILLGRRRR